MPAIAHVGTAKEGRARRGERRAMDHRPRICAKNRFSSAPGFWLGAILKPLFLGWPCPVLFTPMLRSASMTRIRTRGKHREQAHEPAASSAICAKKQRSHPCHKLLHIAKDLHPLLTLLLLCKQKRTDVWRHDGSSCVCEIQGCLS